MKVNLNPDKDYVKEIKEKLKKNGGYCPCRLTKNQDTKCMCKEFRDAIKNGEECMCHCGLYFAQKD